MDPPTPDLPEAWTRLALLRADAGFAQAVDRTERALAARAVVVPCLNLEPGGWGGPDAMLRQAAALVVVDGLLHHSTTFGGRVAVELSGPGDVFASQSSRSSVLGATIEHVVVEPTRVAVLDTRFIAASRRWPGLWRVLLERIGERAERLMLQVAILQLQRAEDRLLAELWQMAERFGRVTPGGVVIPLRLTHATLGRLVSAQRPTVTLALSQLTEEGALSRNADGHWVLDPASHPDGGPM